MKRRVVPIALLVCLVAAPVAARADDLATVRSKIRAAMQSAKSFVVTISAATGFTVTMTFVAPDRYHSSLLYNGSNRDVVIVGPAAYVSSDGKTYRKIDAPPEALAAQSQLRDVPVDELLADRKTSDGSSFGQFATISAGPQRDQHFTCAYDKKTYRVDDCSNEGLMLTFSRYDDPANVVTLPPNIATPAPTGH